MGGPTPPAFLFASGMAMQCLLRRMFLQDTHAHSSFFSPMKERTRQLPGVTDQPLSLNRQPLAVTVWFLLVNHQQPPAVGCQPAAG